MGEARRPVLIPSYAALAPLTVRLSLAVFLSFPSAGLTVVTRPS